MCTLNYLRLGCLLLFISCGASKKASSSEEDIIIVTPAAPVNKPIPKDYTQLKSRYAKMLEVEPGKITNIKLYEFIDDWLNTPYLWGGTDKKGIDCSALMQQLLDTVYNIKIPRTSVEQFYARWIEKFRSTKHLAEGDLIFFRTFGTNVVSHVGLYLDNGRFINSSSSKGVSIGDINDPYWRRKLVGAGRINVALLAQLHQPNK